MPATHADRGHSKYSPSGHGRWSLCPASASREQLYPRTDSPASLLGTWKHEQCERLYRNEYLDKDHENATEVNLNDVYEAMDYVNQYVDSCSLFGVPKVMIEDVVDIPCLDLGVHE